MMDINIFNDDLIESFSLINTIFEDQYMLIGGITDTVYINHPQTKDIDLVVIKNQLSFFGKNKSDYIAYKELQAKKVTYTSSFAQINCELYQGTIFDKNRIDIFILDTEQLKNKYWIDLQLESINNPYLFQLGSNTIRLNTIKYRTTMLRFNAKLEYDDLNDLPWMKQWKDEKKQTAINKLKDYYKLYPESQDNEIDFENYPLDTKDKG